MPPVTSTGKQEPKSAPKTRSGVSSANAAPTAPAEPAEPESPPEPDQPPEPEITPLPRLGVRVSAGGVTRAGAHPDRAIALIQGALSGAGHDPGPFDGVAGPRTRAALEDFAASRGLGLDTQDRLVEVLDALGFDV